MTLACKTADLLTLATRALSHVLFGQHALHCADERKSALAQLNAIVQAAGKLADVAHVEALGNNSERVLSQTGEVMTEMEKVGSVGRGQGVNGGTEKASEEVARLVAETGRLHAEAEKVARETERAVAETERLKAQAMLARSEKMTTNAATERRKAEPERVTAGTEWVKVEVETVSREVAKEVQVQEGETPKTGGYMARMEAKIEATPRSMDYYKVMRNEEDERRMADHARKWVEIARMNVERERKKAENVGQETAESDQEPEE